MPIAAWSIRARAWLAALAALASLALAHGAALAQARPAYTQAELDRMLAPIALYPDPLLSQILMAATYPIEVVEAARWSRANPQLAGEDAVRAVAGADWDPSVKSLVAFPQVLARMDEHLGWTRELGDAFLTQEPQVMETVQQLRRRARAAGTLAPDDRLRVYDDGGAIAVVPADPHVVYVPYYDPRIAYGPWWWPAYPPVVWAPWPGYAPHYPRPGTAVGVFWGPAVRISLGFFFGAMDWHRHHVKVVHVDNYYYRAPPVRRDVHVHRHATHLDATPGRWRHDPWHRRGVAYRDGDAPRHGAPAAHAPARRHAERWARPPAQPVARPRAPAAAPMPAGPTAPAVRPTPAPARLPPAPAPRESVAAPVGPRAAPAAPQVVREAARESGPRRDRRDRIEHAAPTRAPAVRARDPAQHRRDRRHETGPPPERHRAGAAPAARAPAPEGVGGPPPPGRGPRDGPPRRPRPGERP